MGCFGVEMIILIEMHLCFALFLFLNEKRMTEERSQNINVNLFSYIDGIKDVTFIDCLLYSLLYSSFYSRDVNLQECEETIHCSILQDLIM